MSNGSQMPPADPYNRCLVALFCGAKMPLDEAHNICRHIPGAPNVPPPAEPFCPPRGPEPM